MEKTITGNGYVSNDNYWEEVFCLPSVDGRMSWGEDIKFGMYAF